LVANSTCTATRRCALLESGVDGDRASVHVAVPHVSVPWSVGPRDPPDWEPPSCVLGNFPHTFAHCSKWARNLFESTFEVGLALFTKYFCSKNTNQ
jgi:hypothetical protein